MTPHPRSATDQSQSRQGASAAPRTVLSKQPPPPPKTRCAGRGAPSWTDPGLAEALAEMLRSQAGPEPRIFEIGKYTVRVYHPEGMIAAERYFIQQSPQENHIDIFINDSHPYAAAAAEATPQEYPMYARLCVYDAITEYFLVNHRNQITPDFPARLKDQLLRARND